MKIIALSALAAVLSTFVTLPPEAQQKKDPWLHVEVKESKDDPEIVKLNLPFSMVDVALKIAQDKKLTKFNGGKLPLNSAELSVPDIKKLWTEFKKAGNADFVTVEKKTESVRIARDGNYLLIKVSEQKQQKVDIRVPIEVVDALLSAPGEELDIKAALVAMQQKGSGEILSVIDKDSTVRIWVD
ncbi:MAG: hypothetical protein U0V70_20430 [Terriglobia bacterium]